MKIRVTDLETSGRQDDPDPRICELAYVDVDVDSLEISNPFTTLVNPQQPIPAEVSAVHHLIDEDLVDAPGMLEARCALSRGMGDEDYFAAHNRAFEMFFLPTRQPWICTFKCAARAWQDAPGYSNQVLRYHLKVPVDRVLADPPHRALPDCYVTAHILIELLKMRPSSRLLEISNEPVIYKTVAFGKKHKGELWSDVPTDYLTWIIEKSEMGQDIKDCARWWKEKRFGRNDGN